MKYLILTLLFLSSVAISQDDTFLIVALDYDTEQNCSEEPICFGLIDSLQSFVYDVGEGVVRIQTSENYTCTQDGIFRDRFQFVVKIELNGIPVGTLKDLTYDISTGIITVNTNEVNFNCQTQG